MKMIALAIVLLTIVVAVVGLRATSHHGKKCNPLFPAANPPCNVQPKDLVQP